MSAKIPVCILGATGTVGQKFVRLLADHPWFEIAAVAASAASAGRRYGEVVRWREQRDLPLPIADLTVAECAPPLPGAVAFSALDADVAGPILVGLMPLLSERNAEFLHNEVPGIVLTDEARWRMKGLSGKEGRRVGVQICRELIDHMVGRADGFYLIPSQIRTEMAVELVEHLHQRVPRPV